MNIAQGFKAILPKKNKVVLDIDSIVSESQFVRLHGKVHEIKPVLVAEYFLLANSMATVSELVNRKGAIVLDEMVDAYYGVISSVCPTITKKDIRACSHMQVAQLYQFVMDHISGRISDEKKKTLTKMTLPQVQI